MSVVEKEDLRFARFRKTVVALCSDCNSVLDEARARASAGTITEAEHRGICDQVLVAMRAAQAELDTFEVTA